MGLDLGGGRFSEDPPDEGMVRVVRKELVDYIREKTGLDRKTIRRVLLAEESFFVMQIEGALKKSGRERS